MTKPDQPDLLSPPPRPTVSATEVIAAGLSLLWLVMAAVFFMVLPSSGAFDSLRFVMILLAVFLPVALIWVAATAARSIRVMREESQRLQAAIDGMRHTYIKQQQAGVPAARPEVEKKLDEIVETARETSSALATFTSTRAAPPRVSISSIKPKGAAEDQPTLALGTPMEDLEPNLDAQDFIRALNFPETAEDTEGFAALRRALKDRSAKVLITAAQDVLTLLSQEGIYMDDLRHDRAKPEIWRRFAQGERGAAMAALGGVRDRSCLALTAARMREDPIFRDAAHHFLRKFDTMLLEFEPEASDAELAKLSTTRTALAFMLLGRVAGMFS
ncbi:hypothetical protein [Nereida sp. MMG025]|uniref:hypothetical protein n=1 Tax=Nereida sp. MMG025 TaxID=2909981 RepID=UPI001F271347|nr:hypothetical protein [Nereida sp. MMG025]MCF6444366.1 hypothetical protein [Nereida sp. MMG025]